MISMARDEYSDDCPSGSRSAQRELMAAGGLAEGWRIREVDIELVVSCCSLRCNSRLGLCLTSQENVRPQTGKKKA